ncbi:iron-sulfur cluster assembly scaffold protein [Aurantiacibacter luteus]|uniref:Fe-S cluster protein n=1 Tax=Aurantiacibacter luteus TaxID=1581420 RepID=A0A0G9MY67_9SPHN|nr:iron-sulfur cluster assembly scaffold protein [Aurantiacibacter luteus]KLE35544.1 Fe-S cluster protein [Aurantiacibacter luteus]
MSADKLYTPQLLAAAVELAAWPPLPGAALHAEARSPACGSTIALDVEPAADGSVAGLGMLVRACAVGQAAAAVFARHVGGRMPDEVISAHDAIAAWIAGEGAMPDWPDLALIAPARAFPGRHGAMLLPWKAALAALSTAPATG